MFSSSVVMESLGGGLFMVTENKQVIQTLSCLLKGASSVIL